MKPRATPYERTIFVCCNEGKPGEPACAQRGSEEIRDRLKAYAKEKGVAARCRVVRSMCLGMCKEGPNLCVMPDNVWMNDVQAGDVDEIIRRFITPFEA